MKIFQITLFLFCTFLNAKPLADDYEKLQRSREEKIEEINGKYVEALKDLKANALKGEDLELAIAIESEIQKYAASSKKNRGLYIVSATYGNNRTRVDVTKVLQGLVRNEKVDINIKREFGDPAPGKGKFISVTYSIDGETKSEQFPGGDYRLRLPTK